MKKLLAAIFAGLFAVSMTAPVVAQDKKTDGKAKSATTKTDGKAKSAATKTDGKTKSTEKKKTK